MRKTKHTPVINIRPTKKSMIQTIKKGFKIALTCKAKLIDRLLLAKISKLK